MLDSEGLSKLVRHDKSLFSWLAVAHEEDWVLVTSAATLVEARDPKLPQAVFDHALSRVLIRPVTEAVARAASKILAAENLHGHKYAVDAIVAATAHQEPGDVTVLTSDVEDLSRLCLPRIAIHSV
jgi:hypothetical protein